MNPLILIASRDIGGVACQTVNARDLHAFLEIGKDFSSWVKSQIVRARLVDGRDYTCAPARVSSASGAKHVINYYLTLDAGKQVAMMSETSKGFEVRDYFLECERRALAAPAFAIPTTLSGALRLAAEQAETIEAQSRQIEAARPALEFVGKYVESRGAKGFRQVCKLLGANETRFREFLEKQKIMYRLGGEWVPHAGHLEAGRFEVRAGVADVSQHAFNQAKFTPKGVTWIAGEWAKHQLCGLESAAT